MSHSRAGLVVVGLAISSFWLLLELRGTSTAGERRRLAVRPEGALDGASSALPGPIALPSGLGTPTAALVPQQALGGKQQPLQLQQLEEEGHEEYNSEDQEHQMVHERGGEPHGHGHGAEHVSKLARVIACFLLGFLFVDIMLLELVHYDDPNVRSYMYTMICATMSIFCAVLLNQAAVSFITEQILEGQPPRGFGIEVTLKGNVAIGGFLFLSAFATLNILCYKLRRTAQYLTAVEDIGAHITAFAGIHCFGSWQKIDAEKLGQPFCTCIVVVLAFGLCCALAARIRRRFTLEARREGDWNRKVQRDPGAFADGSEDDEVRAQRELEEELQCERRWLRAVEKSGGSSGRFYAEVMGDRSALQRGVVDSAAAERWAAQACVLEDAMHSCYYHGEARAAPLSKRDFEASECQLEAFDAARLLQALPDTDLYFVGDSIVRQLWQSVGCHCSQFIVKAEVYWVQLPFAGSGNCPFKNASHCYSFGPDCVLLQLQGSERQTKMCYMMSHPDIPVEDWISGVRHFRLAPGSREVVVFNGGLHFPAGSEERYQSFLQQIVSGGALSVRAAGGRFIWLETSPQHFPTEDGSYNTSARGGQCTPIRAAYNSATSSWRNAIASRYMRQLGFDVLYTFENAWSQWDAHVGATYRNDQLYESGDCSHFCLPGVPDLWARILFNMLTVDHRGGSEFDGLNNSGAPPK